MGCLVTWLPSATLSCNVFFLYFGVSEFYISFLVFHAYLERIQAINSSKENSKYQNNYIEVSVAPCTLY